MPHDPDPAAALRRRWVETWQRAGVDLERIRRAELQSLDTRAAIKRLFGDSKTPIQPGAPTSGLVEQQAWFALLRQSKRAQ